MAVLRIELDIDSDVDPELHGVLSRIERESARGARVRQLAAAALIYESLRLLTHPRLDDNLIAKAPVAPLEEAESPSADAGSEVHHGDAPVTVQASAVADVEAGSVEAEADEVRALEPPPAAAESAASLAESIPVLHDIVELHPIRRPPPEVAAEPGEAQPADILHIASRPATRSRLMRMRQKGLFNNG